MRTLGIDLGTSGVRGAVLDGDLIAQTRAVRIAPGERRDPDALWRAVLAVLGAMDVSGVQAVAVDGTSGTILPIAADGAPLGPLSMYNDAATPALLEAVRAVAPPDSAARGATSPLARAMAMRGAAGLARVLHEADWIAGRLCGRYDVSDANNALKTGYDPLAGAWPDWLGAFSGLLPQVLEPGTPIGAMGDAIVVAGTTDGCASWLAAEAGPDDGVTALGSTLTVKRLTPSRVTSPGHGVYSHRLLGGWLAGGASNSGGAALARFFTRDELATLSERIDPDVDSFCDFYPLPAPGERFPVNDPRLAPRVTPRPADDARFLHGLLEGIARIEARGYALLAELGAPMPARVLTVGGGAANPVWTAIRARALGVPVIAAASGEAAAGAARLAALSLRASCARSTARSSA